MSVINPNETSKTWQADGREPAVHLFVGETAGDPGELVDRRIAGFAVRLNLIGGSDRIDASEIDALPAAVIQVDAGDPTSIKRFEQLAKATATPLIAASYDPPLAFVRSLIRAGAHDVIPLPLAVEDLETSLAPIHDEFVKSRSKGRVKTGKLVTAIKSVGGVGATSLLTQFGLRFAQQQGRLGRDSCLIDLDVQFGDVAFQLGLQPKLTLLDLIEAGGRLDADLLRSTTLHHGSGLDLIASPIDMMPIEGMPADHLLQIVELARREYSNVLVDLPTNWTNWSLSLVARSDLVLLVTELSVAGINRARRQLNLLRSQDLGTLDIRVIVNRFEKNQAKTIRPSDVRDALGRDVAFYVANDFQLMRSAINRGVPIEELKRKSALGKDIDALATGVGTALGVGQ